MISRQLPPQLLRQNFPTHLIALVLAIGTVGLQNPDNGALLIHPI
jgi:hypothetical protein